MNTTKQVPTSEARAEQVTSTKYQTIKLGIDWHANQYRVVRIIDGAGPEPAQRFTPWDFLRWAQKQLTLAQKVYSCYEAGAGGFVLHRQLTKLGLCNHVVAPRTLDPDHKRVQNDSTDARQLALDLDRFVGGNAKALRLVYVPTPEQEQRRQQSRQRQQLQAHRLSLAAQGRCLLLSQGWHQSNNWWKSSCWSKLAPKLPEWLLSALESYRRLILAVDGELKSFTQALTKAASGDRPLGVGALTLEQINREVCDWKRFKNRKQPGSYSGLCGGLAASGDYSIELPITKSGNVRLRVLLIELAWRMVYYQPQSKLIQAWAGVFFNAKAHKRTRKRAIVAVARRLLVDLWRWQSGRVTPEKLGWVMLGAQAKG
jgi:transposase